MPPAICFIVFAMGVDDRHNPNGFNAATFDVLHPRTQYLTPLPVCEKLRMPGCTSPLGVVGTLTPTAQSVLDQIIAAHPQVTGGVTYYTDSAALNAALLAEPQKVLAAVHFDDAFSLSKPKYILQYNTTRACILGAFSCNDPMVDIGMPLQLAVEQAIVQHAARTHRGDSGLSANLTVGLAMFPHPKFEAYQRDITRLYAPQFVFLVVMLNFFVQVRVMTKPTRTRTHTHAHAHAHARTRTRTRAHARAHAHAHAHARAHAHAARPLFLPYLTLFCLPSSSYGALPSSS